MNKLLVACNVFVERSIGVVAGLLDSLLPSIWGLLLISIVTGVIFALLYGKLVNQERVRTIKRSIFGYVNEAVLYRHDPVLTIKAQLALLLTGVRYLATSFLPIAILTIPSLLIFAGLQTYYGYLPVSSAKEAALTINVDVNGSPFDYTVRAEPEGEISPPLRIPGEHQLVYKLGSPKRIVVSNSTDSTEMDISPLLTTRAPEAVTSSWVESLVYGSLAAPPRGVESIFVSKANQHYSLFGASLPWFVWSVIFILVGGFGAAKMFNIAV